MHKTLASLALALFAVQAVGVYLLCACGRCPVSAALGVRDAAAAEPSCCAGHAHGDQDSQLPQLRDHCGRCAHDQQPSVAIAAPRPHQAVVAFATVALAAEPPALVLAAPAIAAHRAPQTARGPPDRAGLAPEIRHIRMLM
ncbi:MAG: hypothetical protein FJ100_07515 [Deltaproteobacteria bacterium]|nr:hypothetical protein [Deltaproteobacteria bacterium]